jgi:hypothetical protein
MIESPDALLFEPLSTIDPDAYAALDGDDAAAGSKVVGKPITSSFRCTIKHLRSKGGFRACFRGFSVYVVYTFLAPLIATPISALPFIPRPVGPVFASLALATLSMTWTHIVISDPNPKPWYRRLAPLRSWKKIAAPAAALAVAEQLAVFVPTALARLYGFQHLPQTAPGMSGREKGMMAPKAFSIFVLGLVLAFLLVLPADVILTRVQASLLDDAEETIIPFDRTFGGKVEPEIVGGSGVIGMLEAWKTFEWGSRLRLLKAYGKVLAMQGAVAVFFTLIFAAQIFLIVGKDLFKYFPDNGNNGKETEI